MSDKSDKYTENMKELVDGKLSELKSYFCREDFKFVLDEYDEAPEDAKIFRRKDLERICEARGIDVDELIKNRSILETIQTKSDIQDELLTFFHDLYEKAPTTNDFMERIVRRLAPEYSSDPVRLVILKKFVAGGGTNFKTFKTGQIIELAKERFSPEERNLFDGASEKDRQNMILSKIDNSIFVQKKIGLTAKDILELIIDRVEAYSDNEKYKLYTEDENGEDKKFEFNDIELSKNTQNALSKMLSAAGIEAEDTAFERLKALEECVAGGTILPTEKKFKDLIVCVEKDFKKQLHVIKRIKREGEKEPLDERYKDSKRDELRKKVRKCTVDAKLLKLCNDLASGNFRPNGMTKVYLYYFAFMFEMKISMNGKKCEPERDFEKNLFQDYYNDNLLRLLSGNYTNPKCITALENEPTGEGINYKNFAEAIYLYFLCHDDLDMTPGEKIDKAEEIIKKCVKSAAGKKRPVLEKNKDHTRHYRDGAEAYFNILLNKKIDEIEGYILSRYWVYDPNNPNSSRIMVASDEIAASGLVGKIMEAVDEAYPDNNVLDFLQEDDMKKTLDDDIADRLGSVKKRLTERYQCDARFLRLVNALDERIHIKDVRNGRFSRNEKYRMLIILHILACYSSKDKALSMYIIKERLKERGITSVGTQNSEAIKTLINIGFDIKNDIQKNDKYNLRRRVYDDEILNDILNEVSSHYYVGNEHTEALITEVLKKKLKFSKRIKRSELITLHFNDYIARMDDTTKRLDTFKDVFESYATDVNRYLKKARYQPLSVKNILDMYIVIALYFYLSENRDPKDYAED